eukprot:m.93543 g.93543  ORF g.93543 m.93543 type:complete len:285 (+) comp8691_c1_seq2:76-930(+)
MSGSQHRQSPGAVGPLRPRSATSKEQQHRRSGTEGPLHIAQLFDPTLSYDIDVFSPHRQLQVQQPVGEDSLQRQQQQQLHTDDWYSASSGTRRDHTRGSHTEQFVRSQQLTARSVMPSRPQLRDCSNQVFEAAASAQSLIPHYEGPSSLVPAPSCAAPQSGLDADSDVQRWDFPRSNSIEQEHNAPSSPPGESDSQHRPKGLKFIDWSAVPLQNNDDIKGFLFAIRLEKYIPTCESMSLDDFLQSTPASLMAAGFTRGAAGRVVDGIARHQLAHRRTSSRPSIR